MRLRIAILVLLFAIAAPAFAQPVEYPIDASHSLVSFSVGFAGGITSIEGRFNRFEGVVGYRDRRDPSTFYAEVVIHTGSINTGDPQRDSDLMGAQFFDTTAHPRMTFNSRSARPAGDGYELTGTLSLKGVQQEVTIPFRFSHEEPVVWVFGEPRIAARGSVTLDRTDFQIPGQGWDGIVPALGKMMLSREVEISLIAQGVGPDLASVLLDEINANGTASARSRYSALAEEHSGRDTYVFGSRSLYVLTLQLIQQGKTEEAVEMGEFGVELEPENFLSYFMLGNACEANGETQRALEHFEKSVELNPGFTAAQNRIDSLRGDNR